MTEMVNEDQATIKKRKEKFGKIGLQDEDEKIVADRKKKFGNAEA